MDKAPQGLIITNIYHPADREMLDGLRTLNWLAVVCFIIGFSIMLHQYIRYHIIWSWSQILHHEWFATVAFTLGLGIILDSRLTYRHRRKQMTVD